MGALAFGTLTWSSGVAARYGDDYKLAVALFFVGIAVMTADFVTILCEYKGYGWRKSLSIVGSAALVAFLFSIAWIKLRKADIPSGAAMPVSSPPFQVAAHLVALFGNWLVGPHGRWFDKLLGAFYAVLAVFVVLFIAAVVKMLKRQPTNEGKGFLDYKLDAETALQAMPPILEKLTNIMTEVGPALNKHAAALLRATSTAGQIKVSREAALSLDRHSKQVDAAADKFVKNGLLLSEGILGWSTWIKTHHPPRAAFGNFPESLKHFTGTLSTSNDGLVGYIDSTMGVKGASSVLNGAIDRHVASWTIVLQTNKRMFEACNSALEVFKGLS
jgi:hypothetical protein